MTEETLPAVHKRIKDEVGANDVVLYMKGTVDAPLCGFSAAVVQMLRTLGVSFLDVNVLETPELRQGIKEFSDWPTVPQLYVAGEFVGGCDIVREMWESGELTEHLRARGINVSVAATPSDGSQSA